jgi:hypothetical protein
MTNQVLDIVGFLKLVLGALKAAHVDYLIGGAIAEWAWGEPRATQDIDIVINLPIESVSKLSKELEKRDMLVPAEIILDALLEGRADIPINAIHIRSGLKADLYPIRPGDELRLSAFQRRQHVDYGPPIGRVYVHSPEDLIAYIGQIAHRKRSVPHSARREKRCSRDCTSGVRHGPFCSYLSL